MKRLRALSVAGVAAGALATPAAASGSVESFYRDKQMRLIISSEAGGGYDGYGRLLANHLGRFIPGNPTFVVQNMPGGGGVVAANWLYNVAPKDGTVIANVQRNVPMLDILDQQGPQFEATKFNWIGSLNNEVTVCVVHKRAKVQSIAELKKNELIIGGSGPNDTETVPAVLNNLIGTKFKIVSGYPSSTAITLAVERGEVDGLCSSYSSLSTRNAQWFRDGLVNVIVQTSTRKHPKLPNVPLALEFADSPEERTLIELNDARLEIGRPFMAPPGVPAERVEALRVAFDRMTADTQFLADAEREKREINPVPGKDVQALLEKLSKTPKTVIAKLDDAQKYKGVRGTAKPSLVSFTGSLAEMADDGRTVVIRGQDGKPVSLRFSNSRTVVEVAGKPAKRPDLVVGMSCEATAPAAGEEAARIACK